VCVCLWVSAQMNVVSTIVLAETTYKELIVVLTEVEIGIARRERVTDIDVELGKRHRVDFHDDGGRGGCDGMDEK
jgi:hypothetical protein